MFRKKGKILGVLTALTLVMGISIMTIPVKADTTDYYFNLRVNTSDISKRTQKAGGSLYERTFYVRPTYFNNNVRYHAASFFLDNKRQYGVDITLEPSMVNTVRTGSYYITPPSGKYYYLVGNYNAAASSGPGLYVEGRFTP